MSAKAIKRLKSNQTALYRKTLELYKKTEPTTTFFSQNLKIKSVDVVNCTHVILMRVGSRKHPGREKVDSVKFMRHLLSCLPSYMHKEMPFLGNEIIIGKFCVNAGLRKTTKSTGLEDNSEYIGLSIQGHDMVLMVSYLVFMFSWLVGNIPGRPYYFMATYHQHVNCVMRIILNPCYIIPNSAIESEDYEVSHNKKAFPSTFIKVKNPRMGFKLVAVFDQGKMNLLGVNLQMAVPNLIGFLDYMEQFCHKGVKPDIHKRRKIREFLYESQQQQKLSKLGI